ncbi:MAG TPA: hypothetical protein VLL74_00890 [Methanoregula sp.]|nr:hypothetical protein [Methanoregula sp.]
MEITEIVDEEERIAALEQRVRNMDALVKGIVAEMLDLKTVAMAISRQDAERDMREPVKGTDAPVPAASLSENNPSEGRTVIRQKAASPQDVMPAPAEPAMVRIMQPDGTMKLEPRYGSKKTF